jgi:hypothetical protein
LTFKVLTGQPHCQLQQYNVLPKSVTVKPYPGTPLWAAARQFVISASPYAREGLRHVDLDRLCSWLVDNLLLGSDKGLKGPQPTG